MRITAVFSAVAAGIVGVVLPPQVLAGAGFSGARLTHTMCQARTNGTLPVCSVKVQVATHPLTGACIVKVDDVLVLAEPLQVVAWNLSVVGTGTFRFAVPSASRSAIAIDDDVSPVFAVDGVDGATQVRRRSVRALMNLFTYTINIDQMVNGDWGQCTPYDPVIVNRG